MKILERVAANAAAIGGLVFVAGLSVLLGLSELIARILGGKPAEAKEPEKPSEPAK